MSNSILEVNHDDAKQILNLILELLRWLLVSSKFEKFPRRSMFVVLFMSHLKIINAVRIEQKANEKVIDSHTA